MLEGKSLVLRGVEREDLDDRHRWINDPEITRFFTNLGSAPVPREQLRDWYEGIKANTHNEIHFSVWASGKHIGGAQLKSIDWRNRSAEFGVFIGEKEEWGKGYGREITQMLLDYGFGTLNLHRIWLRVDKENIRAIRCYEGTGFSEEGVFREEVYKNGAYRDSVVMSILSREFQKTMDGPSGEP